MTSYSVQGDTFSDDATPPLPPRPANDGSKLQVPNYPEPPKRLSMVLGEDSSSPVHYMRDPHKLVAYLIPFPKPDNAYAENLPDRFLIYTPPPPPLTPPKEGEKEAKMHKIQRKWQEEVREAKKSDAKITSWKGIKSRATKGINTAMGLTTSSNIDFLNRVHSHHQDAPESTRSGQASGDEDDGVQEGETTNKTVGLEEMILIYPSSMPGDEVTIRREFVDSMMRSKDKAQRDVIIATGLLPVSAAIDILATFVWPFGGLLEIDSVWLYSSVRGAKTARSVTKRLHSSSPDDTSHDSHKLKLSFTPSPRLDMLRRYLLAQCHKRDPKLFKSDNIPAPTETDVLEAIGWSSSQVGGETKNWEDEWFEIQEVKDDLKTTMGKAAKEWDKWCKAFEKNPEKALKK